MRELDDRGRSDGLVQEDIEWAMEKGAKNMDEVLNLVRDHKKLIGE